MKTFLESMLYVVMAVAAVFTVVGAILAPVTGVIVGGLLGAAFWAAIAFGCWRWTRHLRYESAVKRAGRSA
jgi:hypothetical protein